MKNRDIGGVVFLILGFSILVVTSFFGWATLLGFSFYSIPLIILGFAILLNKNEDKIERIKHLKVLKKEAKYNGKK